MCELATKPSSLSRPMNQNDYKNQHKYYEFHDDTGHYTNECFHFGMQIEVALQSRELTHLVKDLKHKPDKGHKEKGKEKKKQKKNTHVICI
ncbi:hypothetical protein R6Q59_016199 [Mikania micrantha]